MCDLLTHPLNHKPTNHEWVVDFWFNNEKYNVVKASEFITTDNSIWPYLSQKPYSSLSEEQVLKISIYLKEILVNYDYIIAFECKQQTREILNNIHNNVIYTFFSPLRYANRLSFTFTSNNSQIQKKIETAYSKATEYFKSQATYVTNLINNTNDSLDLPNHTTLLIGQVVEDLAVWNGNEYLNLDNFEEDIINLTKGTNTVYKAHPFSKENNSKIQSNKNIKTIDEEIYRLLASDSIKHVITVSSSVAKEAEFFEKKVTQFFSGYITDEAKSLPFTQDPLLWEFLLNEVNLTSIPYFTIDKVDIRPIRNTYWGYHYIWNIEFSELQLINSLYQQINEANQRFEQTQQQIKSLTQKLEESQQLINSLLIKFEKLKELNQQVEQSSLQIDSLNNNLNESQQQINTSIQKFDKFKRSYLLIKLPKFLQWRKK